jgi:glycosyltransferase involved in cell wall biosynthesis
MNEPKVSVIIPVYNSEAYLKECLESVVNQSCEELEIICVNDCSSDSSNEILQHYEARDDRIIAFSHEINKGLPAARNSGMKIARGEYIKHLDSDDILPSTSIEQLYKIAKDNNSDIVRGSAQLYRNGKRWSTSHYRPVDYDIPNTTFQECKHLWHLNGVVTYLFKRSFVEDNSLYFYDKVFHHEDFIYMSNALPLANRISLSSEPTYLIRREESRTYEVSDFDEILHAMEIIESNWSKYPEQWAYWLWYYWQERANQLNDIVVRFPYKDAKRIVSTFMKLYEPLSNNTRDYNLLYGHQHSKGIQREMKDTLSLFKTCGPGEFIAESLSVRLNKAGKNLAQKDRVINDKNDLIEKLREERSQQLAYEKEYLMMIKNGRRHMSSVKLENINLKMRLRDSGSEKKLTTKLIGFVSKYSPKGIRPLLKKIYYRLSGKR